MKINILCFVISLLTQSLLMAQDYNVLTTDRAIRLALDHNYGIKLSHNNVRIAKNNAHLFNSNKLPTLTANAGVNYNLDNTEAAFSNGNSTVLDGAESSRYNASLDLNYIIFDGLGRSYNFKKLKATHQLSKLEARETIEQTILQLYTIYYSVAEALENKAATLKTLKLSKQRLLRAQYQFDYGQNTKLAVLNANVDINNDSILLLNSKQQLSNYKRDLNLVLGNQLKPNFTIDTLVTLGNLYNKETLLKEAISNNTRLLQINKNIDINNLTLKSVKSAFLPTVGLVGRYGWNKNNNNPASFVSVFTNTGLSGGVNLRWSLFDGGNTITQVNNAQISIETQKLKKEQLLISIDRDFNNLWSSYQNTLQVFQLQSQNIVTATTNFKRTLEKFKIGQIDSITYRQAQLNLFNAQLSKNKLKYQIKLIELQLLKLCGVLLDRYI